MPFPVKRTAYGLNEVYKWLEFYNKFWDDKLNSLKNFVENN